MSLNLLPLEVINRKLGFSCNSPKLFSEQVLNRKKQEYYPLSFSIGHHTSISVMAD